MEPDELEAVEGRYFEGERVLVDGKRFTDCIFIRCALVTSGTGRTIFQRCATARGPHSNHVELVLGVLKVGKRYHDVVMPDPALVGPTPPALILAAASGLEDICRDSQAREGELNDALRAVLLGFLPSAGEGELERLDPEALRQAGEDFLRVVRAPDRTARSEHARNLARTLRAAPQWHYHPGSTKGAPT